RPAARMSPHHRRARAGRRDRTAEDRERVPERGAGRCGRHRLRRGRTTTTSGGSVTPTVIQRLRAAIHNERIRPATNYSLPGETDAAIAAVEQELAAKDAEIADAVGVLARAAVALGL